MPVVITMATVFLAAYYFKGVKVKFLREGVTIGFSWFFISIIIDLFLFLPTSPMQMRITNYLMDIGLTYFIIPFVFIILSGIRIIRPTQRGLIERLGKYHHFAMSGFHFILRHAGQSIKFNS